MAEFIDEHLQRHAILQCHRARRGKAVHDAGKRRSFLRHDDENFTRGSVFIHTNGQITFVARHRKFVRDRMPLNRQMPPYRTALHNYARLLVRLIYLVHLICGTGAQGLRTLGTVTINRHSLQTQPPAFDVSLFDFFDGDRRGQIHRL